MGFRTDYFDGRARLPDLLLLPLIAAGVLLGLAAGVENLRLLGAVGGLLFLLAWPIETAVGIYAFLIPWEDLTVVSHGSDPTTLLWYAGGIAIVVLVTMGMVRQCIIKPPRAALFWSLLILWGAASALWAIKPEDSVIRIPTAVGLCLLYLAAVSVRISRKELSWITLMAVAGGCTAALYSAYEYFHGNAMLGFEGNRASLVAASEIADPNVFAAGLLLPLSIAFGEVLSCRNRLRRLFMLGATGAIAFAVFLTMSRGALLSMLVVAFVYFRRLRLNWRMFIPVGIAAATLLAVPNLFFHRFEEAAASRGAGRLDIWEAGLRALGHYGVMGAGLENFGDAYTQYAGSATFFRGFGRAAHNVYLGTSVELGILGIALLLAAVVSQLRSVQRLRRSMNHLPPAEIVALEAACWAMLSAGFFLDLLWRKVFWFSWILLVLTMNAWQEDRELHRREFEIPRDYRPYYDDRPPSIDVGSAGI